MANREPAKKKRTGTGWLAWAAILALVWLGFRVLGPGGQPLAEVLGIRAKGPSATTPDAAPGPSGERAEPAPADAGGATWGGTVRHADGTAAEGAIVEAVFKPAAGGQDVVRRSAPSGADGAWFIDGAPDAWSELRVFARHGPLRREFALEAMPATGSLELDVTLPATLVVGGIVLAAEDGRALEGIKVRLADREARTDAVGRFAFADVPAAWVFGDDAPVLELSGAGRADLRHPLDRERSGLDDLLLRLDAR